MTRRRLQFSLLAWWLSVFLVSGAVLPSPTLWRCHHSARVVTASFLPGPAAMPCRMGGPMPASAPMACCRHARAVHSAAPTHPQALSPPDCNPTLTRLATLPAAKVTGAHEGHGPVPAPALLPPFPPALPSVPITLAARQRPPPAAGLSPSFPDLAPGLRAPPVA